MQNKSLPSEIQIFIDKLVKIIMVSWKCKPFAVLLIFYFKPQIINN
jgi:hypothetical protein